MPAKDLKYSPPAHFPGADSSPTKILKFAPPERVFLTGSAATGGCLRTAPGTGLTVVDVAVEVPKGFFQEKVGLCGYCLPRHRLTCSLMK
jgi:hypothetical protein